MKFFLQILILFVCLSRRIPEEFNSLNEVSDAKFNDYDYDSFQDKSSDFNQDNNPSGEGFFSFPGTFPSLEELGKTFFANESLNFAPFIW